MVSLFQSYEKNPVCTFLHVLLRIASLVQLLGFFYFPSIHDQSAQEADINPLALAIQRISNPQYRITNYQDQSETRLIAIASIFLMHLIYFLLVTLFYMHKRRNRICTSKRNTSSSTNNRAAKNLSTSSSPIFKSLLNLYSYIYQRYLGLLCHFVCLYELRHQISHRAHFADDKAVNIALVCLSVAGLLFCVTKSLMVIILSGVALKNLQFSFMSLSPINIELVVYCLKMIALIV